MESTDTCKHAKHSEEHNHSEEHSHSHNHAHGKASNYLFFLGLVLFAIAFFLPSETLPQNILFSAAMLLSGYHIIIEGIMDTFNKTKEKRKFTPNVHILMTLAAFGAVIIGKFEEGALLIIIFAAAHFLEEYAEGRSKREK